MTTTSKEILGRIPRQDAMELALQRGLREKYGDDQLAPLWAANMRYTYAKVQETEYPEYAFANGDVLPIDSSMDPAADEWEYYTSDGVGQTAWVGDDGESVTANAVSVTRETGKAHEQEHGYTVTIFDMERFQAQSKLGSPVVIPVLQLKEKIARRAHDAWTNWVWAFGDSGKGLLGLCNHPNITVTLAPTKATGGLRVWDANATNDEIAADVATAINTVPEQTQELGHVKRLYFPPNYWRLLRDRRLGAGDGNISLLEHLQDKYKGDASGQLAVEFKLLRECQGAYRSNPHDATGADTSGITGNFLLAVGELDKDEGAFVQPRKYTTRTPQEDMMKMKHYTHSKIGGCKLQKPLYVHRFDFGA